MKRPSNVQSRMRSPWVRAVRIGPFNDQSGCWPLNWVKREERRRAAVGIFWERGEPETGRDARARRETERVQS